MTDAKIAAPPISQGLCEVPGRGHQMNPDAGKACAGLAFVRETRGGAE